MLHKIKWAYQRVVRGWDDTATWGLDSHFITMVIPPLQELCERALQETHLDEYDQNHPRRDVYLETLRLIRTYNHLSDWQLEDWNKRKEYEALQNLVEFFGRNIGWYWD